MKLIWVAIAAVLLSGCAVVPVPVAPDVSVGVGVPIYRGGYGHGHYRRHYGHGPYGRPYYRRW
jgi:hypothetical protein